ncbi:integrator complex subunit 11 isoform X1 [Eupeodes corollae]|uniref:integrator complex subunit 11 isoform X1 n=1 Tax=Eupeodes corollae TaxID=290404 RepID=UPI0024910E35|nr:integrator complex subunit 11 isoform X1 [Eupeodes corollae]
MPDIKLTPLGAGQDVGRSCLLLSMGGKNIMLDCGMHMGFNDERRFPDFSYIVPEGPITSHIDCVIISHFHLEHCGALPYMSEVIGFNGPIYMTRPTKALVPILYEELRKLNLQNKGNTNYCSTQAVKNCIKKITAVDLHQSIMVDNELEIKAYYAGHVLGAAMFWIKVGSQSVVYTGDFNMNPDRHLGAAWIDKCQPDVLITESHYATTNPTKKRCSDEDFLKYVHDCLSRGGKVLIPIFILGRAQELCLILDQYWQKMNLTYPIYFATESLTERTNSYYKMFISWTNQQMHKSNPEGEAFEFKHIKSFHRSYTDDPEPMVVLATNGMLQAGLSMQIFKEWAHDEKNLLILPDICEKGTLGHKIMSGAREIQFRNNEIIKVLLQVEQMDFDAVADLNGLIQLIEQCAPKNVVLVHGHHEHRQLLLSKTNKEIRFECEILSTGETCVFESFVRMPTEHELHLFTNEHKRICRARGPPPTPIKRTNVFTVHVAEEKRIVMLNMNVVEGCKGNFNIEQTLNFRAKYNLDDPTTPSSSSEPKLKTLDKLFILFREKLKDWKVKLDEDNSKVIVESVELDVVVPDEKVPSRTNLTISWKNRDDDIARYIMEVLSNLS